MDNVDNVIRIIARLFYGNEAAVILEAVMRHPNQSDERLAQHLRLSPRQVRKALLELQRDRIVKREERKEANETGGLARQTMFWTVDRKSAIDSTNLRLLRMQVKLDEQITQGTSVQGYICRRCNSTFTALDAMSLYRPNSESFHCENCGFVLEREDDAGETAQVRAAQHAMLQQIDMLRTAIQDVQDVVLPHMARVAAGVTLAPASETQSGSTTTRTRTATAGPGMDGITVNITGRAAPTTTTQIGITVAQTTRGPTTAGLLGTSGTTTAASGSVPWTPTTATASAGPTAAVKQESSDQETMRQYYAALAERLRQQQQPLAGEPLIPHATPVVAPAPPRVEHVADQADQAEASIHVGGRRYLLSEITPDVEAQMTDDEHAQYAELMQGDFMDI
eukprot:TRINITY_DN3055_c0_g1_i1.p1 TRINITY_DN3055_c0_g1~~TRINITY_DN3055_c0_g1_i1.p1  ORF type:complete len:417 (+),score=74.35 TRINITY_DN3055_c0_g1_i1:71-1252(+)